MATAAANKRLTREYKTISENPPPYITAHPSENNILEWHYLLTGPPDTPYTDGQYWGTLHFPPEYPFKPPAIRMITPSGRFQPATRLCLSISDFHPKSFNPAWEVSTILIGLLSFMTSEEMTTGSVRASDAERRIFAQRSSWWNSTGGGSIRPEDLPSDPNANPNNLPVTKATRGGPGSIKPGDGGARFRAEWPELDAENWAFMRKQRVNPVTGASELSVSPAMTASGRMSSCAGDAAALRRRPGASGAGLGAVVEGGQQAREAGRGWLGRHKWMVGFGVLLAYVVLVRLLNETPGDAVQGK